MRFKLLSDLNSHHNKSLYRNFSMATQIVNYSTNDDDNRLELNRANGYLKGEAPIERAWAHWKKIREPKLLVAPMVDNSELPFRLLCRKYGADAAYTPMLHSRIFSENEKYRSLEFSTCKVSSFSVLNGNSDI
ncbi:hypothetical protein P3L10_013766 [Capsicum annuum]